jgi:dTDP-4-dehydrorhamnose reductase
MKRILVTGGNGRFAKALKKLKSSNIFIYTDKKQLDINKVKSIESAIKKHKPDVILHLAGLSRPLKQHDKNITKSISLNIIGTSNLVNACIKNNLKIIYFSTIMPGPS